MFSGATGANAGVYFARMRSHQAKIASSLASNGRSSGTCSSAFTGSPTFLRFPNRDHPHRERRALLGEHAAGHLRHIRVVVVGKPVEEVARCAGDLAGLGVEITVGADDVDPDAIILAGIERAQQHLVIEAPDFQPAPIDGLVQGTERRIADNLVELLRPR